MIRTADSCELACAPVDVAVAMATEILASMVAWSATAAEMYDESPNDVASAVDATLVSKMAAPACRLSTSSSARTVIWTD